MFATYGLLVRAQPPGRCGIPFILLFWVAPFFLLFWVCTSAGERTLEASRRSSPPPTRQPLGPPPCPQGTLRRAILYCSAVRPPGGCRISRSSNYTTLYYLAKPVSFLLLPPHAVIVVRPRNACPGEANPDQQPPSRICLACYVVQCTLSLLSRIALGFSSLPPSQRDATNPTFDVPTRPRPCAEGGGGKPQAMHTDRATTGVTT